MSEIYNNHNYYRSEKTFIESMLDSYGSSGRIFTSEQINNLNLSDKYNYIRFHCLSKKWRSSYMYMSDMQTLIMNIYKKHNYDGNFNTENFPMFLDDCGFVIYVDIDYDIIGETIQNATIINDEFARITFRTASTLIGNITGANIMSFVPEQLSEDETGRIKCGAHTFIFLPHNLYGETREQFILEYINKFKEDANDHYNAHADHLLQHGDAIPLTLDSIIDPAPLKRYSSIIIPFSKKDFNSRNYRILTTTDVGETLSIPNHSAESYEAICNSYKSRSTFAAFVNNNGIIEVDYSKCRTVKERRELFKKSLTARFEKYEWSSGFNSLIRTCCFFFDFCSGLSILREDHPFIQKFKKGIWFGDKQSGFKFVKVLMDMYYTIFYLHGELPTGFDEHLPEIILETIDVLYIRGGKTNREDILNQITNYVKFNLENRISQDLDDEGYYKHPNMYDKLKDIDTQSHALRYGDKARCKSIPKSELDEYMTAWTSVDDILKCCIQRFATYVNDEIMKHIETEIEPFNQRCYDRNVDRYNFEMMYSNTEDKNFYYQQFINLNKGFIFAEVFQYDIENFNRVVIEILKSYTEYYIYIVNSGNNVTTYIYNIQQSNILSRLPYNQWIIDNYNALDEWLSVLIDNIIDPISKREIYEGDGGINLLLKLFVDKYGLIRKPNPNKEAITGMLVSKNPIVFKNQIRKNIAEYYSQLTKPNITEYQPALPMGDKAFFAVRNGIIEWYFDRNKIDENHKDGKWMTKFSTNNHNKIIPAYSAAKYHIDYDPNQGHYRKTINELLDDIYPDPQDKNYILDLLSSTVCPIILKDVFLFMFGTGADGKSTINSILMHVLGGKEKILCYENGKQFTLQIPHGYYSSMSSNVLTQAKQRGGTDEGGAINLKNRTYCVTQEPPKGKINVETIKDWTGQGTSHARGLYEHDEGFTVNSLIVCETNIDPVYDLIDDGVKRRFKIYRHRAKFVNESNKHLYRYADPRYVHPVDPGKIEEIKTNVEYWEAFLHILLEHALELLNNGIKSLQNIPTPDDIQDTTNRSFGKSSSLAGWLENNVASCSDKIVTKDEFGNIHEEYDYKNWLLASDLIGWIKTANKNNKEEKILSCFKNSSDMTAEIVSCISNAYAGRLFRIQDPRIYKRRYANTGNVEVDAVYINKLIRRANGEDLGPEGGPISKTEFIRDYLGGYATKCIQDTLTLQDYGDIVILGAKYTGGAEAINPGNNNNNNFEVNRVSSFSQIGIMTNANSFVKTNDIDL